MKTILLRMILLLAFMLSMLPGWAYDFSALNEDGIEIYYDFDDFSSGVIVTYSTYENGMPKYYEGDIVIPESVVYLEENYDVLRIGTGAFSGSMDLNSVSLPSNLITIYGGAFSGCTNLTSITLPSDLSEIGEHTFWGCSALSSIKVNNYYPEDVSIGCEAFDGVAADCKLLVPMGSKNRYLSSETWNIFSDIEEFGDYEIVNVKDVYERYICSYALSFPEATLVGCCKYGDDTTDQLVMSSSITNRESNYTVSKIGNCAFKDMSDISYIDLPNTITSIGDEAFANCINIWYINIPQNVSYIGSNAFQNCTGLVIMDILVHNPDDIVMGDNVFDGAQKVNSIYVPIGSYSLYKTSDDWKNVGYFTEKIILADGIAYSNDIESTRASVKYTRTFNNTHWQALYLPFDMSYDEWSPFVEIAELYNVRGYDTNDDGEIDDVYIDFNRLNSGSIKPNVPYIVKAKNTGTVTFSCANKKLCAVPDEEGTVECSSTKTTYAIHGIYETKTDLYSTGAYCLAGGQFCQVSNETVTLAPYRSYLTITQKNGGYNDDVPGMSMAPKRIAISVDGEETTGIDDIFIAVPHDNLYYDLMGRKVMNPSKGIYIQNGKKIYVK